MQESLSSWMHCLESPLPPNTRAAPSGVTRSSPLSSVIRLASSRALERTLNHRSATSIRADARNHLYHPARAAPSGFTRSSPLSSVIRLASLRALERTLNHRSTTSIRGDTSTRNTRSTGVAVRSLHGQPSAQTTASRSSRHHRCPSTCAHTC